MTTTKKVAELEGTELNYWVAKATGRECGLSYPQWLGHWTSDPEGTGLKKHAWIADETGDKDWFQPSTDWSEGGPIIEREKIMLANGYGYTDIGFIWLAHIDNHQQRGVTPLIAAMRCYVASVFGEEVSE